MFGSGNLAAALASMKQRAGAGDKKRNQQMMNERREAILGEAPREDPRWVQALGAVGAGLQDLGHSRGDGHLDRFTQAQERMRQARREYDQRSRRFEQLSRNIPQSDQQFWNAFALGGEEAAMNVLNSRSERKYDSQVRNEDRRFRREERIAGQEFQAGEGAANRANALRIANERANADTAVIRNARAYAQLGPDEPLNDKAIEAIRMQIGRGEVRDPMELMMLVNMGIITEAQARAEMGIGGGNDAIAAALDGPGAMGPQ